MVCCYLWLLRWVQHPTTLGKSIKENKIVSKNKKKIVSTIIKTKPGSVAFVCLVGSAIVTLSAGVAAFALYYQLKEI